MSQEPPTTSASRHPWHATIEEAKRAPIPEGARSALLMQHGAMKLRYYAPKGEDLQQPHEQDELYVIASGSGTFVSGEHRLRFGPGDALFAAAGQVHRFEDFSADFATWVIFYGPTGGENPR